MSFSLNVLLQENLCKITDDTSSELLPIINAVILKYYLQTTRKCAFIKTTCKIWW